MEQGENFVNELVIEYITEITNVGIEKLLGRKCYSVHHYLSTLDLRPSEIESLVSAIRHSPVIANIHDILNKTVDLNEPYVWGLETIGDDLRVECHGDFRVLEWNRINIDSAGRYIGTS